MKQSELHHHGAGALRKTATGLACLALIFSAACDKTEKAPPAPPAVQVMTVIQKDVPIYEEWIGSLDGEVNAVIRPQVTGYLIKQHYREGDLVKKGQLLFEIDPRTFEAAVDQAKGLRGQQGALYQNAKANLARVKPLAAKNALAGPVNLLPGLEGTPGKRGWLAVSATGPISVSLLRVNGEAITTLPVLQK